MLHRVKEREHFGTRRKHTSDCCYELGCLLVKGIIVECEGFFFISEYLLPSVLVKGHHEDLKAPRKEINTSDD